MTKKLSTDILENELKQSKYFAQPSTQKKVVNEPVKKEGSHDSIHDTMTPRTHDTMTPPVLDVSDDTLEHIRSAVRVLGMHGATYRFTEEEKKALADIVYTYKNMGIRTSENEVTRIALNCLMEDYKKFGEQSVVNKVLRALNS